MIRLRYCLLLVIGLLGLLPRAVADRPPITRIQPVRWLSAEMAAKALPVRIEGQVVWINRFRNSFFLYDGTVAIFVRGPQDSTAVQSLSGGDLVRVSGVTSPGGFAPDILAKQIEVLGNQPRPKGDVLQERQRLSPSFDGGLITSRGRLISMTTQWDSKSITLVVSRNDLLLNMQMPYSESNEQKLTKIMFDFVEFTAVCGTVFNDHRQAVGRIYYAYSADDFVPVSLNSDDGPVQTLNISELFQYKQFARHEVKTHGIVTCMGPRELYLRGADASLKVAVSSLPDVEVGDEVMIQGVVWPQPVSPAFRASSVKVVGKKERPQPIKVHLNGDIDIRRNYDLVEIDAELVEIGKSFLGPVGVPQHTLLCRSSGQLFEVLFPPRVEMNHDLKPGAQLRLTGICSVARNMNIPWYLKIDGFSLELQSAEDAAVLVKASWWTAQRLMWLLGIVLAATGLFAVWVGLLRKTVHQQTDIIREKVERESVHCERQRIARELHDNLLQGLVGMAIKLRGCFRGLELCKVDVGERLKELAPSPKEFDRVWPQVEQTLEKNRQSLQGIQSMLDACSEESRASVLYLRSGVSERTGLVRALRDALKPFSKMPGLVLEVHVAGEGVALQTELERNLMLAAKEAVTNAVKHASATQIDVCLTYSRDSLVLDITDDGKGFDLEKEPARGHFGLQGMRERMKFFGANVDIDSIPGRGTEVLIRLDSIEKWEV